MAAGSMAFSAYAPAPLNQLALSGLGDIMPGNFVVPQNPIKMGAPAPVMISAPAAPGMGNFRRMGGFGRH